MATINPYLNFPGNTEEAFNFYKSVFGGEFLALQRFKDAPADAPGCSDMSKADGEKIMHIALPIGKSNVLMATDALESMGQKLEAGNNFTLSLFTESEEETERLFNGLSAGGTIQMPLEKTFWGAYFGMFIDKFGMRWNINYDLPK
ncbi:PhnB protein [Filimonas lacunae]|uniref:PhnB protein n=1 Tax=Filimonas lacunae TaxID=477680 RepID=A0A173MLJ1_9BACT|nr:VOC family protein [Filimonas lacunae]BAV08346.1 DNA binding 3-demethylubiquinone-9 3-methyltransferase domain protein [Filimonas lacunae]SIT33435.1 PhnB protein [Filimonas lacunae]